MTTLIRKRTEPAELVLLSHLKNRMTFTAEQTRRWEALTAGYFGEKRCDHSLEKADISALLLPDLHLSAAGRYAQIDTLLITDDQLIILEIKHFQGDYEWNDEGWWTPGNLIIPSPLIQLERSISLLKRILQQSGLNHMSKVSGKVLFTHPDFTLHHLQKHPEIVLPTQMRSFITSLKTLRVTSRSHKTARFFQKIQNLNPYERPLPDYSFQQLKKGIFCPQCGTSMSAKSNKLIHCTTCSFYEAKHECALRMMYELRILFPHFRPTGALLYQWCGKQISKRTFSRILTAANAAK